MSKMFVWADGTFGGGATRNPVATSSDTSYALRSWDCCEGQGGYALDWRVLYASGAAVYAPPLLDPNLSEWYSPSWQMMWTNPDDPTQYAFFEFYCSLKLYDDGVTNLTSFIVNHDGYAYDGSLTYPWGDATSFPDVSPGYTPDSFYTTIALQLNVMDPKIVVEQGFVGARELEVAVASLSPPLRAAFLLRDVEGLTTAEAAADGSAQPVRRARPGGAG